VAVLSLPPRKRAMAPTTSTPKAMTDDVKTVRELIQISSRYLQEKGIDSPRLNAERLLGDVLSLSRIELYLQHDRPVSGAELDHYRQLIRRRSAGEPLQTLIGSTEFYSRTFKVKPGVFIPRPETEILVARCIELLTPHGSRLAWPLCLEIGSGTGVIGVTLAAEIPALQIVATDINPAAIELSEQNARRHGVAARMTFLAGSLFAPVPSRLRGSFDLLVSNPPYVRRDQIDTLPMEVAQHDPREALDGGSDGLIFYRALAAGFATWLRAGAAVAVEIGEALAGPVGEILSRAGCHNVAVATDYSERPRVVTAQYQGAAQIHSAGEET
jgi:release factor glutamine methyltransferase